MLKNLTKPLHIHKTMTDKKHVEDQTWQQILMKDSDKDRAAEPSTRFIDLLRSDDDELVNLSPRQIVRTLTEEGLKSMTDDYLQELRTKVETEHQRREKLKRDGGVRTIMYDSNDNPHTLWVHLSPEQKAEKMLRSAGTEYSMANEFDDHKEKKATKVAEREWQEDKDRQYISDMR